MKHLVNYLTESSSDFQKRTLDTSKLLRVFEYCFKLHKYQNNSISLKNKTDLNKFYKQFTNAAAAIFFNEATRLLRKFEITSKESLSKFLHENAEKLEEYHVNILIFKDFNDTATEKEYKQWKSSDEYIDDMTDEEAEKYKGRMLVIYDRHNPASHIIKQFDGVRGKSTSHLVNMFRMDFKHKTGTKYYDCYDILYDNYIKGGKDLEEYHDTIGLDD